jgi:hypothetical protein
VKIVDLTDGDRLIHPLRTANCHFYVDRRKRSTIKHVYQSPFTDDPSLNSKQKNLFVVKDEFVKKFKADVVEISCQRNFFSSLFNCQCMNGERVRLEDYLPVIVQDPAIEAEAIEAE